MSNSGMRVGMFVLHQCIRTIKMGWLLMERGHEVCLISERALPEHGFADFNAVNLVYTGHLDGREVFMDQLYSTFKMLRSSLDMVIVANEPDWPVKVIHEALGGKIPIIRDIHDMVSRRTGEIDDWEKIADEASNGYLVPSAGYKRTMQERYPLKPCFEVLSCVPEKLFPVKRRIPSRRGIVWEGGLKGKAKEGSDQFEYRSWAPFFQELAKNDVEVFAYPSSRAEDYSEYEGTGIMLLPPLPYHELLKNLTAHEVGLVGSPFPTGAFTDALPNKLFEYIAAGIPMVAINAPAVSDFIAATGFGYTVKDAKEVPDAIAQCRKEKLSDLVWESRTHWTLEKQIQKVETCMQKVKQDFLFETQGGGEID